MIADATITATQTIVTSILPGTDLLIRLTFEVHTKRPSFNPWKEAADSYRKPLSVTCQVASDEIELTHMPWVLRIAVFAMILFIVAFVLSVSPGVPVDTSVLAAFWVLLSITVVALLQAVRQARRQTAKVT